MEQQQPLSPGLLYSVAPENLSQLHLQDDTRDAGFEWEQHYDVAIEALAHSVMSLFKTTDKVE